MPTLMSGLNIALRSLLAQAQAVEITEHNVANAGAPGYRRQAPVLAAAQPDMLYGIDYGLRAGLAGAGVEISSIRRFNAEFYDTRFRASAAAWKQAAAHSQGLSEMEALLNETGDQGMPAQLSAFWNNWQSLAADPTSIPLRTQLLTDAQQLTTAFHDRAVSLSQMRADMNQQIRVKVGEINDAAQQVAALNAQIARYQAAGQQPNDFLDSRDRLLDRLAEISGAVSYFQPDGQVAVSIGGRALVSASSSVSLQAQPDPANPSLLLVTWQDGAAFSAKHGELKGIMQVRDTDIPQQLAALDQLASGMASQVNALHRVGFGLNNITGLDFFTGSDALSLNVNAALDAPSLAAASAAIQPADGSLADQIAALRDVKTMNGGLETLLDFSVHQAALLGQQVQSANEDAVFQQQITTVIDEQRESLGGVSLDEEAANLVRYQKAYQAAARIMTAYDEMLDQIINRMGLVGRS